MIGTSDGKQYEDNFEYLAEQMEHFLKDISSKVNPEGFDAMMSLAPLSTNIEDRRGEPPMVKPRDQWGKSGQR